MQTVQAILHRYYTGIHVPSSIYPYSICYTTVPHIHVPNSVFFKTFYASRHGFDCAVQVHFHNLEILCMVCFRLFIYEVHVNDVHILPGLSIMYANKIHIIIHHLNNSLKCIK